MIKFLQIIWLASLLCLSATSMFAGSAVSPNEKPNQQTAVRVGPYVGLQFGYLYTDFGNDLSLYAPGKQITAPEGTYFTFRPEIGYNFTKMFGIELGGMQFSDSAQSAMTDPIQKSHLNVTNIDLLAVIHLPLDRSGNWVGTPKIGLSIMSASLQYQFTSPDGNGSPWNGGSNINETSTKTLLVPTIGLEFDHSYNRHWIMSFSYQYYYSKYSKFNDPYFTPVSTLGLFSTGVIYKF